MFLLSNWYFWYFCVSLSILYLFQLIISGGQLLRPLVLFLLHISIIFNFSFISVLSLMTLISEKERQIIIIVKFQNDFLTCTCRLAVLVPWKYIFNSCLNISYLNAIFEFLYLLASDSMSSNYIKRLCLFVSLFVCVYVTLITQAY